MAQPVQDAINRRFPKVRASISSEFAQNTDDIASMQAAASGIGLLALIVGGIVVANTMIMSIYERTREIGTLRALGWPGKRILSQIMQESVLLCLLSAILGSIGAVVLLSGLAAIPFAGGFMLRPAWAPGTFVSAVALTLVLGLLGGFYPAWRASRLQTPAFCCHWTAPDALLTCKVSNETSMDCHRLGCAIGRRRLGVCHLC